MDQEELAKSLITELTRSYGLELAGSFTPEHLETLLTEKINGMIRNDFDALVQLLYRIDINEARLRQLLMEKEGEDAGRIMARMIIERQTQKIRTRQEFKATDPGSGEERW
jgi:hypothetical protein